MPHLRINAPDEDKLVTVSLVAGAAYLVGRQPNPTKLPYLLQLLLRDVSLTKVPLSSQRVSANHLLVLLHDGAVQLFDLASRNGTTLHLQPQQRTLLEPNADVEVQLAPDGGDDNERESPQRAVWKHEDEFAAAVVNSLTSGCGEWKFMRICSYGPKDSALMTRRCEAVALCWPTAISCL
jgi:hypothetical protein